VADEFRDINGPANGDHAERHDDPATVVAG
jgi:hypothetical protein